MQVRFHFSAFAEDLIIIKSIYNIRMCVSFVLSLHAFTYQKFSCSQQKI